MKLLLLLCCLTSYSLVVIAFNSGFEDNSSSSSNSSDVEEYVRFRRTVGATSSSSDESNSTSSSDESDEVDLRTVRHSLPFPHQNITNYRNESRNHSRNSTRYLRAINDWIYIESKRHPNYMLYMSAAGNVYIYPKDNYPGGWNQKWSVEVDITGSVHYKKFINKQNYNVLYADDAGHAYGDSSKSVTIQYWEMIPVDNGQYYYFKNRHNGRILDSGELQNCASSSTCCCGTAHAYHVYTGTDYQKWKVY